MPCLFENLENIANQYVLGFFKIIVFLMDIEKESALFRKN